MLFQAGALFDSMSVFDNVAFPAGRENAHDSRPEIAKSVTEMLKRLGLEGMENKYPSELSGGMQKRVALARALIRRPKILMLDEPTTGLDPTRTASIHHLVRSTQQNFALTVVMVSHDVPQVFEVSDQIAYMNEGKIDSPAASPKLCLRTINTSSDFSRAKRWTKTSYFHRRRSRRRKIGLGRRDPAPRQRTFYPARIFGALFAFGYTQQ